MASNGHYYLRTHLAEAVQRAQDDLVQVAVVQQAGVAVHRVLHRLEHALADLGGVHGREVEAVLAQEGHAVPGQLEHLQWQ